MRKFLARITILLSLLTTACGRFQERPRVVEKVVEVKAPLAANIREGRVRDFSPDIDYFPEKTSGSTITAITRC
jgi:hypothetical protein